jgi:diguanylate cyclase (GGDEF)-like protein
MYIILSLIPERGFDVYPGDWLGGSINLNRFRSFGVILVVALIIAAGFVAAFIINFNSYRAIIKQDIYNITRLVSTNVFSEIQNLLVKPVYVSLTMANDSFVKKWLEEEHEEDRTRISNYLSGIKDKYSYSSAFLISASTLNYYNVEGLFKTVSRKDPHDDWYYSFVDENSEFRLDIDTDQANRNLLSLFVNCRIDDSEGNLLGVTGVGLEISGIREIFSNYNRLLDIDTYLIDSHGIVRLHEDEDMILKGSIFDDPELALYKARILENLEDFDVIEYKNTPFENYLVSRYIAETGWYLIVTKDTTPLNNSFRKQLLYDIVIITIVLALFSIIASKVISVNQKRLSTIAMTDALTGIYNRRALMEILPIELSRGKRLLYPITFVMIDIDGFKKINDLHGHIEGDRVLREFGGILQVSIRKQFDSAFRYGGDEFLVCLPDCGREDVNEVIERIRKLASIKEIAFSTGVHTVDPKSDNFDLLDILSLIDKEMYVSKGAKN